MAAPQDHEARERALDPRGSFHLEAPAGSGKTAVLLARFLTLLARINDSPRELLALTFTRKAAGEFRERAMKYFWSREKPETDTPPHERRLLELADQAFQHLEQKNLVHQYLHVPERLPVTTFHGFCAQLLKAAPHEAGVPLEFQLLEGERDAEWQKQEALEELRRRLNARPETDPVRRALVQRLVRLNNNWPRLARELRDLLARRDTLKDFLALAQGSLAVEDYANLMEKRLSQVMAHILRPLATALADTELSRRWPQFHQAIRETEAAAGITLPANPPGSAWPDICAWQCLAETLLTKSGQLRKRWPGGLSGNAWPEVFQELPPDFLARLQACRKLPLQLFSTQEVGALQDLILLLHAAWETYDELCRHHRVLDFIAIEEAALRMLNVESPGELLLRLDWRLRHLLVDEFQDTSANQMELLCRLLAGWTGEDGRTFTVVGDPKQSIYGWRQARLDLFLESREGLPCNGKTTLPFIPLNLTTNFRATPTLITWVNRVFGDTVMQGPHQTGGLIFQKATPGPASRDGEAPCLALFAHEDRDEARTREAQWLACRITRALEDLPAKEYLALLLFARTHLTAYLSALQEAGLVPKVREGLKLKDSRVVQHLHNLARALVRPQDDMAWAALLTGPWLAPDLASLAAAAQAPGTVWPEKLAALASTPQCPPELASLTQILLAARERVGRESLVRTLGDFLGEASAWAGVAAWEGALGVACARTYLALLAESDLGLPEATFLKADFALDGAYQPPDPRAEDSPVEVLTVHGAKGLEFHTVFLPFLDWQPLRMEGNQPPPFLLEEIPGTRAHVLGLAPPAWQTGKDSSYRLVRKLKDDRVLAEARRVFYVAVTRAQERLFLSGVLSRRKEDLVPSPDSPLAWLWEHYGPGALVPGDSPVWPDPPLQVEIFPEIAPAPRPVPKLQALPQPWEFIPEPPPYRFAYPSQEAAIELAEDYPVVEAAVEGDNLAARARGEVTHRLLETLVQGNGLPGEQGVAAALVGLGVSRETAQNLAPQILAEVTACLQEPFLRNMLTSGSGVSELLLEDRPGPEIIRRGRLDLLAFDGKDWWLVDFKSSRPHVGDDWEDFLFRETDKYAPQLLAYREMVAKARGISLNAIRLALYFTACQKAVELGEP
ncbi:MAG: UvrD-helicase domain-containing protein [Syntrophobacterales bacterium]|jgi:ATP-dependent helicase/nuclease subunit A